MELLLLIHNNCGDVEKVLDKWFKGFYERLQIVNWAIEFNIVPAPPWLRTYPYNFSLPSPLKTTIKYTPE